MQSGWKDKIGILKSLKERCSPLEDIKSYAFFKIVDAIAELDGPPLIIYSILISMNYLEYEMSKLKDKWEGEFDSLSYFFDESIKAWTIDYVNLNNNISIIVNEA